jgi:dolichyl-phosphate-mannose--protein O-mannosyl transferase
MYCFSLLLALRFGGRTYPGIFFPNSTLLNWLLNGNQLFTHIGYDAVLLAGFSDTLLTTTLTSQQVRKSLRYLKWLALSIAVIIAFYGFFWAFNLGRLP